MKFKINKEERYTILSLEETTLNTALAPELKSQFVIMHNEGVHNLILDLAAVKFVDSSGLSAILTANRLWGGQGTFVLTGIEHDAVKKLIEISRVNTVLTILPTISESIDFVMMEEIERELKQGDEE